MTLSVDDVNINRIGVVDDDSGTRAGFSNIIQDLDLEPVVEDGPLLDFSTFITNAIDTYDAMVCDYQLMTGQYAGFNGDQVVSTLSQKQFPALLITAYKNDAADRVRNLRQYIPVMLGLDDLEDIDLIRDSFIYCIKELKGNLSLERKTYRTLVRIEHHDNDRSHPKLLVKVPAWDPKIGVGLFLRELPLDVQAAIKSGSERLHAKVNLGADSSDDVYFTDWETA